jgi:MarR family transcriptional regulator, 2-MHQ and catechol-resistance regulon repressor
MEELLIQKIIDNIKSIKPFLFKHLIRPGMVKSIIPTGSYYLLTVLKKHKILSMKELGIELLMLKSNVTALVNTLITEGLVERLPATKDRRVVKIKLTNKGIKALSEAKKIIYDDVSYKLSELSEEDLIALEESLKNVKDVLSKVDLNNFKGENSVISLQRQHFYNKKKHKMAKYLLKKAT